MNLFRNHPALAWMIAILGFFILLPLGYAGIKNWGIEPPAVPVIDTWEFVWGPFFTMLFWSLAPALFTAMCVFAYWRIRNIAITTIMVETMAIFGLYIYLTVFIIAMIANLFNSMLVILMFCYGCGWALLIGIGLALFIIFLFPILLGLFGNRKFFAILAAIALIWLLLVPGCAHIISKWSNLDKEIMKRAKEKRTVVIDEPVVTEPVKGKGAMTPNEDFEPIVINKGDDNQTIQKDEREYIIIYGKGGKNTNQATAQGPQGTEAQAGNITTTADDKDE